jgi:outer membrane immunogenic protein
MKIRVFVACVSAAMASSSHAADLAGRPRPVTPAPFMEVAPHDWGGFYVGAQIGWQSERNRFSDIGFGADLGNDTHATTRKDGIVGGLHGGYNYQVGSVVFGIEADAELTSLSYAWRDPTDWGYDQKIRAQGSLRGRLGYAFDRTLVYTTGGLAVANVSTTYCECGSYETFKDTAWGWTAGAGLQHAFDRNWSARIEYRYTDLGSITHVPVSVWTSYRDSHQLTSHAIRAGVTYAFAAAPAPIVTKY